MKKLILDVCCGPRMMWFDKQHEHTIYVDQRIEHPGFIPARPNTDVRPDIIADFRNLPFPDNRFKLVVMDPPHIHSSGPLFRMTMNFGKLEKDTWFYDIRKGVNECFRVLEDYGILIFKWNETQISKVDVLKAIKHKPLFGHPVKSKIPTHWMTFMKIPKVSRTRTVENEIDCALPSVLART